MAETVTEIHPPARIPERVTIAGDYLPAFTPRELEMIREQTGRAWTVLMGDDDSDERLVVTAWLKLRRSGHDLRLADMADVVIELVSGPPDPTSEGPSSSSSPSAGSGG